MGHEVGRLATQLYPSGVLIEEDHLHHEEAVQSTLSLLQDPNVAAIFEAAFISDGVRIRVDILERLKDGAWNLIEVKSAASVKDVYTPDVAVQYYVLEKAGLKVKSAGILHLNNQYVYDGNRLELDRLFTFADLTRFILDLQDEIPFHGLRTRMRFTAGTVTEGILQQSVSAPDPKSLKVVVWRGDCRDEDECVFHFITFSIFDWR